MRLIQILAQISLNENELNIPKTEPTSNTVTDILSILFAIMGAVAFLIIVLAGMRYSLSRGNPDAVSKSKNAIIYAAVGLVVAMMAFSIVRFIARTL